MTDPTAQPEWQDISTAPRDGTEILVFRPLAHKSGDKQMAIKRSVNENNFCWPDTIPEGREAINYTNGACYPTHFMFLPEPPKEK